MAAKKPDPKVASQIITANTPSAMADYIAHRSIGSKYAPHAGVAVVWQNRTDLTASPIKIRSAPSHLHRDDTVPNYTRQNAQICPLVRQSRFGFSGCWQIAKQPP